jgi:hypothetical protein
MRIRIFAIVVINATSAANLLTNPTAASQSLDNNAS